MCGFVCRHAGRVQPPAPDVSVLQHVVLPLVVDQRGRDATPQGKAEKVREEVCERDKARRERNPVTLNSAKHTARL